MEGVIGLFSFIGGLFGSGAQKKASDQATAAQVAATNRGIDLQNQQYQQTRNDYMPYTQAGTAAIGHYGDLIGNNGANAQSGMMAGLRDGPLYASMYRNGEESLLQNAAATGGLRGGNTERGLADFGADTFAKVYQDAVGNYGNLAGLGLGATGSVSGFGQQHANNVTGLYGDIGTAQARNYLTKGGINAANWNNFGSFLDQAASAGTPFGGGGGSSFGSALSSIIRGG